MNKERRLGRGLAALLGEDSEPVSVSQVAAADPPILRIHRPEETEIDGELSPSAPRGVGTTGPMASAYSTSAPIPSAQMNSAPMANAPTPAAPRSVLSEAAAAKDGDLLLLSVHEIDDNPFQPRRDFSESEIASLAESLKEHDMLQPILVRRTGHRWQLISGERRLRAAIKAGWTQLPARVRQADDRLVAELAIVENLQRKDLNPIEKALSFRRYLEQHHCTQDELGQRLKIDRSTIANLMRLLELPTQVQKEIQTGAISAGHARALLPLGDEQLQREFSQRIQREGWSVRDAERLVQERIAEEDADPLSPTSSKSKRRKSTRPNQLVSLEQQFRMALGTKVDVRQSARGRGQIVIHFRNGEEFDRLKRLIGESAQSQLERLTG